MACAKCGRQNPAHARFCGGCGGALAPSCPSCGAECEPDARFCTSCGQPLPEAATRPAQAAPSASQAAARKVVTVVFADLIGSVALHERLDAESGRRETERYHRAMTVAVEAHGGRVVQLLGDGVLAVFGVPRVAEDDAIRGVRAAVGMQRAYREMVRLQGVDGPLAGVGLRVAVNTGEMVVGDDETVIGDVTNVAARLQSEARDGDVIVGEGTQRLIGELVTLAPLGAVALRGRAESVRAWRVVSLDRPAGARATRFVGREAELGRLLAVWDDAVASRGARLAVLLGSPGLGKSRLVGEVARRAGEHATVLSARCDAAGGPTFAPVAEALRVLLRIEDDATGEVLRTAIDALVPGDDAERARIVAGVSALFSGASSSPEETFFAVRRLLAALAAVRPVLLIVDDVHWAAPLLLDLVEHLVQWSGDVPLAILAAARPELRDVRSSLASAGGLVRDVVTLGGLDAASSMQLAAGVAGAAELPAALVGRVLATSEGNPLFLAELVRMMVQDGVLRRDGERWVTTVEVARLDMPPTIGVLLAARIERLRPEERLVLERAAVVGRRFSRAAVALLVGGDPRELDARLEALRRSELVEPDTGWFLGEPALRFHHVLIRDAAYRRVLKETRAELHERVAGWMAERVGEAAEHEEMLGWHLEQAHLNLRELGPLDERGRALGERAARHLGAAGRRALARDDLALASSLLGRAIAAQDTGHPMRTELVPDWCEALLAAGEVEMAADAIAELARVAGESERLRAWHACFAGQLSALIDPQSLRATAERVAAAAEVLAAAGDAQGEAKAHAVHAGALARLGAMDACEAALDKALAAARHARDRRRANSVLAGAPVAALWGPSPVTRASGRCLDVVRVLRITQGAPAVEAVALRCQAVLEALRGRGEAARRMVASSRRMVEEMGLVQQLLEADVFAALIELLEGDAATAEAFLATAYAGLREHGLAIDAARAAALLGRAVLAQGRAEEAEALSHQSESLAGDDLKAAIAWRGVRAEAVARRGEPAAAVELARAAVELAAATDALLDHADARIALATALRAAGRPAEAAVEEQHAAELWRQKGATLLLERSASAAAETAAVVPSRTIAGRVRENAATAEIARLESAILAHDAAAIERLIEALDEVVHHPLGVTWDHDGARTSLAMLLQNPDLAFRHAVVATLGERLALSHQYASSRSVQRDDFDVGAAEAQQIALSEIDERGRRVRVEFFVTERLASAIARLYERYAELSPEGAERQAAAAIARGVAAALGLGDDDGTAFRAVLAPDIRFVDHQTLGFGSARGAGRLHRGNLVLHGVARDMASRVLEAHAVEPDALVARRVMRGTDRSHGGAFEKDVVELWAFDVQGRLTHLEHFAPDDAEHALRRLTLLRPTTVPDGAAIAAAPRDNFAIAHVRRLDATWAAGDDAAFVSLFSPAIEVVHHPTGATFGHDAVVQRFLADAVGQERVRFRHEPCATLGDAVALCRVTTSSPGMVVGELDSGAFEIVYFAVIEADAAARATRVEAFAAEHLGDAVVALYRRHAALVASNPQQPRADAVAAAVAAVVPMNVEAIGAVLAPDVAFADRRRLGLGAARGAERYLHGVRSLVELTRDAVQRTTDVLVATDRALLLRRHTTGIDRTSDGTFELELLMLWVFGDDARITRIELFDVDDAASARAGALADGTSRLRAESPRRLSRNAATAHLEQLGAALDARDEAPLDVDGRLARWEMLDGDDVDAALARFDQAGIGAGTPPYGDARVGSAGAPAAQRVVENAAPRIETRMRAALMALDQEPFEQLFAPGFRAADRRRGALFETDRASYLAAFRPMFESFAAVRQEVEHLATRGDRLSLGHVHWWAESKDGTGPVEFDWLVLVEVDEASRAVFSAEFDPDDVDVAYAELDARWAAGEGARYPMVAATMRVFADALARRDWAALAACCAADLIVSDHRRLGWEPLHGPSAYVAALRALVDLAPDTRMRLDHVETAPGGFLVRTTWVGSRAGGAFEEPSLMVGEVDEAGRMVRFDQYEADRLDAARARFAEVGPGGASDALGRWLRPNAATRARDRVEGAIRDGDWEAMRAAFAPGAIMDDRRRLARTTIPAELGVQAMQDIVERASDFKSERYLLAVFGERISLEQQAWRSGAAAGAPIEVEMLSLHEVDDAGRLVAIVDFDPDDRHAAFREANARLASLEPAFAPFLEAGAAYFDAVAARDPARLRAMYAPGAVVQSWRRNNIQRLDGVDACVESVRTMWELTAEACVELLATPVREPFGSVAFSRLTGTLRDGGPFEILTCSLAIVEDGRFVRFEHFEPDDAERALARFAELSAERAARHRGTLHIPPNSASRASDRSRALNRAGDVPGLRALCAEDAVFDDRRPLVRTVGGQDMMVADAGQIPPEVWRHSTHELLAAVGDRLCLHRHVFRGDPRAGAFEIETLTVTEVDPAGRVAALVIFGPDDRRAASLEMLERYARGEGAGVLPPAVVDSARSMASGDVAVMRAALDPEFEFVDHRRTGLGRQSAEEYVESFAALCAMADEIGSELLWHVATAAHGSLSVGRLSGVLRDGGPFESLIVRLNVWEGERFVATEIFELEDLDRARARFDEIGRERAARAADPLRIPPNAATRAGERLRAHVLAGDWDGLRELCAAEFVFDDRRALLRTTGDRDTLVANSRHIGRDVWQRATRTLLATSGDRLALHLNRWGGASDGASFEVECLEITELDAAGRLVASVIFDAGDRRAAAVEMMDRYMRGEGARTMPARQAEFLRAMNAHDLAAARAAVDDDFAFVDHRRTGVGRLASADEYVASLAALYEQSADLTTDVLYHVAIAEHGSMSVGRMFGTLRSGGGAFESVFVRINRYEDGHCRGCELFEVDDLATATERFARLGHAHAARACGSVRIPVNVAIRAFERFETCVAARDWDGLRELYAPDTVWEDRRPLLAMTGGRDQIVEIARLAVSARLAPAERSVLAAPGDRLLLTRSLFRQGGGEGAPDIEMLQLFEVDEQGRFVAVVWFDGADRRAASLALHQRLAATSESALIRRVAAFACAVCQHDLAELRSLLPDDLVWDDHRRAGPGRLAGARAYAWAESLLERCPDACVDQVFHLAVTDHVLLWVGRASGTPDGGDSLDVPFAAIVAEGRVEVFALDDLAAAQVRFDELCAAERGSSG